ncbi:hypothetical protein B0H10DRAFT_1961078 [Mycena sp. CBHHK59/15]|nr:hypothetical protein B0H10DRAFT_1961078 [Mycena sp. CBHHK59/15]
MPEIFEAGYFFPCYILFFIVIITLLHSLNVIGLWSDLSTGECTASVDREVILLAYARTLDKRALARGCLSGSPNDLQDFADAIPDTHGLMIHAVWQGLPPIIWHQISLNHASWESFCNVLQELHLDIETVPLLWHNPDPTNTKKKKKARSVSLVQSNVSDSDDEDIDTAAIIQQSDDTEIEDLTFPSQPPKASHGEGTDLSHYFWPRCALPVLSSTALSTHDAIASAGMRLIYTRKQWNGITQVPRGFLKFNWNGTEIIIMARDNLGILPCFKELEHDLHARRTVSPSSSEPIPSGSKRTPSKSPSESKFRGSLQCIGGAYSQGPTKEEGRRQIFTVRYRIGYGFRQNFIAHIHGMMVIFEIVYVIHRVI